MAKREKNPLAKQFESYCGTTQFDKFLRELNTHCLRHGELRFWMQELWERFSKAHAGAPRTFGQIAKTLCLCCVHHVRLKKNRVRSIYYYGEIDFDEKYDRTCWKKFPFANTFILARDGPQFEVTPGNMLYCEECRRGYGIWNKRVDVKALKKTLLLRLT
jgi:hypothetical protein